MQQQMLMTLLTAACKASLSNGADQGAASSDGALDLERDTLQLGAKDVGTQGDMRGASHSQEPEHPVLCILCLKSSCPNTLVTLTTADL